MRCWGETSVEIELVAVVVEIVVELLEAALMRFVHTGFDLMPAVAAVKEYMDLQVVVQTDTVKPLEASRVVLMTVAEVQNTVSLERVHICLVAVRSMEVHCKVTVLLG